MSVVMTCDGVMSEGHVVWACWGFEASRGAGALWAAGLGERPPSCLKGNLHMRALLF